LFLSSIVSNGIVLTVLLLLLLLLLLLSSDNDDDDFVGGGLTIASWQEVNKTTDLGEEDDDGIVIASVNESPKCIVLLAVGVVIKLFPL